MLVISEVEKLDGDGVLLGESRAVCCFYGKPSFLIFTSCCSDICFDMVLFASFTSFPTRRLFFRVGGGFVGAGERSGSWQGSLRYS